MATEKPITVKEVRDQLDKIQNWVAEIRQRLESMSPDHQLSLQEHGDMIGPRPLARGCNIGSDSERIDPGPR